MPPVSQSTHGFSGSSTLLAASAAPGTSLRRSTSTAEASISCPLPTEFPEAPEMLYETRRTVECEAKWRGDAQLITQSWWYHGDDKSLVHLIQYQTQANGL